jgi:hypothetical protein
MDGEKDRERGSHIESGERERWREGWREWKDVFSGPPMAMLG